MLQPNVPILNTGAITIDFYRDWLWGEHACPPGVDPVASALRFTELWIEEIQRRWPNSHVVVNNIPGVNFHPLVTLGDLAIPHLNPKQAAIDLQRLGDTLYEYHRDEWLVRYGSDEHKRMMLEYMGSECDS